jgi:hypothetical protein
MAGSWAWIREWREHKRMKDVTQRRAAGFEQPDRFAWFEPVLARSPSTMRFALEDDCIPGSKIIV